MRKRDPVLCLAFLMCLAAVPLQAADDREGIIIRCPKPYDSVVAGIRRLGGVVTYRYENVDAVAARVPKNRLPELTALAGKNTVFKDRIIEHPRPVEGVGRKGLAAEALRAQETRTLTAPQVAALPANYLFNNNLTRASILHAQGMLGQGVIVGVIDTGTANSPVVPALSGTVVGGENFVASDPVKSATSRRNDPHGTWVGSMIASHVAFGFFNTSGLVLSLKEHSPESILSPCPDPPSTAVCFIPMVGTAPLSRIYALKVFASTGGGAPESRIIAAMDRAITLRRNFNKGVPSTPVAGDGSERNPFRFDSLKIEIVNMSLVGPTLFAGRDLEDQLTQEMLKVGITIVAAAGNEGFAAMTGGSPGTGLGTLTAGAASTVVHERVLRDLQFGVGFGALFRPAPHHQTAWFSSRGPTADGRLDPDVIANGFASFAQGTCDFDPDCLAGAALAPISLVSGTSFSSPTTAGAAALLRREEPAASATKIRNALVASANPKILKDGSGPIDQGSGFLDLPAALSLLKSGNVGSSLPMGEADESVRQNIEELGFRPIHFQNDRFSTRVANLKPGQVAHFFVPSVEETDRLVVSLENITPELPPAKQNLIFGDDIFFVVQDAPTSFSQDRAFAFVNADSSFPIDHPQTGLVRIALQGDWTNAGKISVDLTIERQQGNLPPKTAKGKVGQGELVPVTVEIPRGKSQAVFELFWKKNWGHYPTDDIDLILCPPNPAEPCDFSGATLDSPERVVIAGPAAGTWTAFVLGFTVHSNDNEDGEGGEIGDHGGARATFTLRASVDGVPITKGPGHGNHD